MPQLCFYFKKSPYDTKHDVYITYEELGDQFKPLQVRNIYRSRQREDRKKEEQDVVPGLGLPTRQCHSCHQEDTRGAQVTCCHVQRG